MMAEWYTGRGMKDAFSELTMLEIAKPRPRAVPAMDFYDAYEIRERPLDGTHAPSFAVGVFAARDSGLTGGHP